MADEREMENLTEVVEMSSESDSLNKLGENDMASGKDVCSPDPTSLILSSGDAPSITEGDTKQKLISEQGVNHPPTSTRGYFYPDYDGTYSKWDNQGYFIPRDGLEMPYHGMHTENGSLVYYMPGYNSYSPGSLMAADGQCVGQQQGFPTRHLQTNVSYGSGTMPVQSWDAPLQVKNPPKGAIAFGDQIPDASPSPTTSMKFKSSSSAGKQCFFDGNISRVSTLPSVSKPHIIADSSNLPGHPLKALNKMESGIRTSGVATSYHHEGKFSSLVSNGQGRLSPRNGVRSFRSEGRTWADNERLNMAEKFNRRRDFEASNVLTRGPRANRGKVSMNSRDEKDSSNFLVRRDIYNLPDFQIKYEVAKFFMIKSFSEDDVHKSIKYNVWASTPNGNNKLDAAFRDAEARVKEVTKCPIFLFFSVNASGQFVGLAEMVGPVDFKKSMDFWQQDKWNGFFPLKWHIIKDIPNGLFRSIILENNDNRAVTYSRDTQEINLPQGLKMLQIFKNYKAETSILDDFYFYEERGKSLSGRRGTTLARPEVANNNSNGSLNHSEAVGKKVEPSTGFKRMVADHKTSLITLTKNLLLNTHLPNSRSRYSKVPDSAA